MKRARLVPSLIGVAALLASCSGSQTTATGAPPGLLNATKVMPEGAQPVPVGPSASDDSSCNGGNPTASLAPKGPLPAPGHMPAGSTMAQIANRGYLIAGVDQNTYFWGYRNSSGDLEGFDIDMVRQVAQAIFGPDYASHLHFTIVPNADRQEYVSSGTVDLVAQTMTINCDRQEGKYAVDFSSEYYDAHQEVLVAKGSGITSLAGLNGKRVCAPEKSTSLGTVQQAAAQVQLWEAPNIPDCLVMLQQGQVDAISTDDTILEGFVAQDPNVEILTSHGSPVTLADEPYGMAISPKNPDLVRFVNAVLAQEIANGTWAGLYKSDLRTSTAPPPPKPEYRA
jgi:polar amino acid transport system substrate-binding protein